MHFQSLLIHTLFSTRTPRVYVVFCKTNKHLKEYYGKVMTSGDDSQKAAIDADGS